ncbi:hypothetical protein RJZ56_007449, partial [Blastomyces dermatitidis]
SLAASFHGSNHPQFIWPDGEPGSSPDNPIDLNNRMDEEHDTEPLSDDRELSRFGGDTEHGCGSETGDERSSETTPIQDLEELSRAQPRPGSCPTGPTGPESSEHAEGLDCPGSDKENVEPSPSPPQSISTIPDNVSQDRPLRDIDATVSGSFRHPLEADTGCPHILLHREARDGSLELLLWAPIWRSEDDIAKVYPDQLKRYKERFGIRFAIRASQVGKRAPSPFPEPRRSFPSEKAAAELSLGIMPKSRAQID